MNETTQPNSGDPTEPVSQPLELTRGVWVVLALILLLGVSRSLHDPRNAQTLRPWGETRLPILRQVGQTHNFSFLGIQILPVDGWTYLATTDDALADQPTFVNSSTQTIISLRLLTFGSWPPTDKETTQKEYGDVTIEWIELGNRRWGRLTQNAPGSDGHVTLMVMTHRWKSTLNPSVDDFCRAIRLIDPR